MDVYSQMAGTDDWLFGNDGGKNVGKEQVELLEAVGGIGKLVSVGVGA